MSVLSCSNQVESLAGSPHASDIKNFGWLYANWFGQEMTFVISEICYKWVRYIEVLLYIYLFHIQPASYISINNAPYLLNCLVPHLNYVSYSTLGDLWQSWQPCLPQLRPSFFLEAMISSGEDGRVIYIRSR